MWMFQHSLFVPNGYNFDTGAEILPAYFPIAPGGAIRHVVDDPRSASSNPNQRH